MTHLVLVLGGFTLFGLIAWSGWYYSEHQQRLRELGQVDPTRIADAKDGEMVRIVGVLRALPRAEGLLRAPLSGREGAHWDVRVLEYVSRGKSGSYVERFRESASQPFLLEDESGRAIVETAKFQCAIVRDQNLRSGTFQDATPEMEAMLGRHGYTSTNMLGLNRGFRYEEGVLEPGERVTVLGRARWEDDPDDVDAARERGGYRGTAQKRRLVIEASSRPVRASDDPKVTG
jgi:hypothetical protein